MSLVHWLWLVPWVVTRSFCSLVMEGGAWTAVVVADAGASMGELRQVKQLAGRHGLCMGYRQSLIKGNCGGGSCGQLP